MNYKRLYEKLNMGGFNALWFSFICAFFIFENVSIKLKKLPLTKEGDLHGITTEMLK